MSLHGGKWKLTLLVLLVGLSSILFSGIASAYSTGTYGSGKYGSCDYGVACTISITSNGTVSLNVTPTSSGVCTIQSDNATVTTDDSNGYTLTLADSSTSTSLTNGPYSISATSGTFASPTTLSANHWGYRVDGVGSFGSGPTSSQNNASPPGTTFSAIESSTFTPDTIASTSSAADPGVSTTVWYGACSDTTVASGAYTTSVIYTAVAN